MRRAHNAMLTSAQIQCIQNHFYLLLNGHSLRMTKSGKEQKEDPESHSWLAHNALLDTPQPPIPNVLCAGLRAGGLQVI